MTRRRRCWTKLDSDSERLPAEAQRRVTLLQADGLNADEAVHGRRFAAVLCHGVLGYLEQPEPFVDQLCRCAAAGGVVSIMTGNAKATAVQPALERRWDDALAAFDARTRDRGAGSAGASRHGGGSQPAHAERGRRASRAGTGYGCSSTGSSSVEPSWTPAMPRRWRRRPRSNSKPADETPTANSVASFISWGAKS